MSAAKSSVIASSSPFKELSTSWPLDSGDEIEHDAIVDTS